MLDPTAQTIAELYLTYRGLPAEMSEVDQQDFLKREAQRIAARIDDMRVDLQQQALRNHRAMAETPAPYLTRVGLISQAWDEALRIVLAEELHEQMPEGVDAWPVDLPSRAVLNEREEARILVHAQDPERWRNPLNCSDPGRDAQQLVERLWGTRTATFRYYAEALIQARIDDQMPVPTTVDDPLYQSFTNQLIQRSSDHD